MATANVRQPTPPRRRESLFNCVESSDVLFVLNNKDKAWFPGHRSVVEANPVFRVMMGTHHPPRAPMRVAIIVEDDNTNAFRQLLRFMYGKRVMLRSVDRALKTLRVADKYLCAELATLCIDYLNNNISVRNVLHVIPFIQPYIRPETSAPSAPPCDTDSDILMPSCNQLLTNCLHLIDTHGDKVLARREFPSINENTFHLIANRTSLPLSSKAIARWSRHQCKRKHLRPTAHNLKKVLPKEASLLPKEDCIIEDIVDESMNNSEYYSMYDISQVPSEYHSLNNGYVSMNSLSEIPPDYDSVISLSEIPPVYDSVNSLSEIPPDYTSLNQLTPANSTGAIPKSSARHWRGPDSTATPMEISGNIPQGLEATQHNISIPQAMEAMQLSDGEQSDSVNMEVTSDTSNAADPNLMRSGSTRRIEKSLMNEEMKLLNTAQGDELVPLVAPEPPQSENTSPSHGQAEALVTVSDKEKKKAANNQKKEQQKQKQRAKKEQSKRMKDEKREKIRQKKYQKRKTEAQKKKVREEERNRLEPERSAASKLLECVCIGFSFVCD